MATHVEHLESDGRLLAEAAEAAGLDAPVPTCPQWTVTDLLHHLSGVHRWATSYLVADKPEPPAAEDDEIFSAVPRDDSVLEYFRAGHAALVEAARACPPYRNSWTFLPAPSALAFWSRRQAHETAVHRFDAEAAANYPSECEPGFAADGIDELLVCFYGRPGGRLTSDTPVALAVVATDVADAAWTLRIGPEGRTTSLMAESADCTVAGPAADLYRLLWNRVGLEATEIEVTGDLDVLTLWSHKAKIVMGVRCPASPDLQQ